MFANPLGGYKLATMTVVMHAATAERVRREIAALCRSGLDSGELRRKVLKELRRIVPIDAAWFATVDPATLLFTSSVADEVLRPAAGRFIDNELLIDDVNQFARLAHRASPVATLSAATSGRLDQSERYREILAPLALGDELRVALRSAGSCWGFMCLHRERGRSGFSQAEVAYIEQLAPHLAVGLRTSLLTPASCADSVTGSPGLIIMSPDGLIVSTTATADAWLSDLMDYGGPDRLPEAVLGVAARVRARADREEVPSALLPRARLQTRSGRWLLVHGARLTGPGQEEQVAIFVEEARPAEVAPLILEAYQLTKREGEIVQLLALGHSTAEIGRRLCITENTIQDHLKSVFDKVGVRSRRELIASIFTRLYMPGVRSGLEIGSNGWFAGR